MQQLRDIVVLSAFLILFSRILKPTCICIRFPWAIFEQVEHCCILLLSIGIPHYATYVNGGAQREEKWTPLRNCGFFDRSIWQPPDISTPWGAAWLLDTVNFANGPAEPLSCGLNWSVKEPRDAIRLTFWIRSLPFFFPLVFDFEISRFRALFESLKYLQLSQISKCWKIPQHSQPHC